MKNKVLVELVVPTIEETYNIFLPINRKVGNVIVLVSKAVNELSGGYFVATDTNALYNGDTGKIYEIDTLIRNTDIRNGSRIILM